MSRLVPLHEAKSGPDSPNGNLKCEGHDGDLLRNYAVGHGRCCGRCTGRVEGGEDDHGGPLRSGGVDLLRGGDGGLMQGEDVGLGGHRDRCRARGEGGRESFILV